MRMADVTLKQNAAPEQKRETLLKEAQGLMDESERLQQSILAEQPYHQQRRAATVQGMAKSIEYAQAKLQLLASLGST